MPEGEIIMNSPILRAFDAQVTDVNQKERTIVARVQNSDVDRYNSSILTRGLSLKDYERSLILLWEHGRDSRRGSDPVGRGQWIKPNPKREPTELIAKYEFLRDDFSQQRYEWYRDQILRNFSVRILPDWERCSPATRDEIKANPSLGRGVSVEHNTPGVFMYRGGSVAEVSCTSVPGNISCETLPDQDFVGRATAIMSLVERGLLWLPDEAATVYRSALLTRTTTESMGGLAGGGATIAPGNAKIVKPCDDEDEFADDVAAKRYITHEDDKWTVHAEDGKPMGSYGSEGEARKRLGQIEYFKHQDKGGDRSVSIPSAETPVQDIPRGLRIESDDHGSHTIYDGAVRLASYGDRAVAEKAITAMSRSQTFGDVHDMLIQAARAQQAADGEILRYIQDEMNLRLHGSVGTER